ncbi:MAG: coproporphyrinogen dehydrogenase HemZ [Eubacteriales bacterium]
MRLTITGDYTFNTHNLRTICMLFFPGESFSENGGEESPSARVEILVANGGYTVTAEVSFDGRTMREDRFVPSEGMYVKLEAARLLYEALTRLTGYNPPWGCLTGVRPAKRAGDYIRMYGEDAKSRFERDYLLSGEKSELAFDIYRRQEDIIKSADRDSCSLYISIPFCPTRCAYCSFVSYTTPRLLSLIPEYIEKLCRELEWLSGEIERDGKKVRTIYVGGGTPSILDVPQLDRLLGCVEECFDISGVLEYTVECGRPDTVTPAKLCTMKGRGVGRVSINTQSTDDAVLRAIGRSHSATDFYRAFQEARDSGIGTINTDLINALPGERLSGFMHSVEDTLRLSPENITLHTFCVKKSSDFKTGGYDVFRRENADAQQGITLAGGLLREAGYVPYYAYRQKYTVANLENTGYSNPGHICLYNIYMMEEVHSVYAAGAGAVTKLVNPETGFIQRRGNFKYPYEYIERQSFGTAIFK